MSFKYLWRTKQSCLRVGVNYARREIFAPKTFAPVELNLFKYLLTVFYFFNITVTPNPYS